MAFREGDPVEFIDKYGVRVTGHFSHSDVRESDEPLAFVIAQPFGPETGDVMCSLPISKLRMQK